LPRNNIGCPVLVCLVGSRLLKCHSPRSDWDFIIGSIFPDFLLSVDREEKLALYKYEYTTSIELNGYRAELRVLPVEKIFTQTYNFSPSIIEVIISITNGYSIGIGFNIEELSEIYREIPPECLALSMANYAYSFMKRYRRATIDYAKRAFETIRLLAFYYYLLEKNRLPPADLEKIVVELESIDFDVPPYIRTLKQAFLEFIRRRKRGEVVPNWALDIISIASTKIHQIMTRQIGEIKSKYGKYCNDRKEVYRTKLQKIYRKIVLQTITEENKAKDRINTLKQTIFKAIEAYKSK